MRHLRPGDWCGLALMWLRVAAAAIRQAERVYEHGRGERHERYLRARDALLERLRQERYVLRTEHAILEALRRRDEQEAA